MTTRDKILAEVKKNQPLAVALPDLAAFKGTSQDVVKEYIAIFTGIGGGVLEAPDLASVKRFILEKFGTDKRIVTTLQTLSDLAEIYSPEADPHSYENVELAVIKGQFAVAENGAVWFTDEAMGQRVLPFICQHLIALIDADAIVSTMHEAYTKIGQDDYGFGVFIAGPSKTADIEQSLVLGAHGPISMTTVILDPRSADA